MATDTKPKTEKAGDKSNQSEVTVFAGGPEAVDEDALKAVFVERANTSGTVTLNETEVLAVAKALGIKEEEFTHSVFHPAPAEEGSPVAGLTPATGSGGVPYKPEAATKETKEAAKEAQERAEDFEAEPNDVVATRQNIADRRLAAAVASEK